MKRFGLIEQPARTFAAFWRPSNFTEFTPQGEEIVEIDEGSVGELKIYGKNGNCPHNFGTIPTPSFV